MIPHTAYAKRTEQGWIGVYSYPKDGAAHTEHVRSTDGSVRVFRREMQAQVFADRGLRRALNSWPEPRSPAGKVFVIRHTGGRVHVRAEAQRHFRVSAQ